MSKTFLVEFETDGQAEAWLEMMLRGIHANARVSELETHEQGAFVRNHVPNFVVKGLTYWYTTLELTPEYLTEGEKETLHLCKTWLFPAKETR